MLVLVIDQLSKAHFEGALEMYQQIVVIPDYFSWTLAYNTGAAFSFLAESSGWQRWLFALIAVVVSAVLVVWLKRLGRDDTWLAIALAVGVLLWAALYNQLLLTAVNPQLAQSRGIAVKWVEYAFVILVAVAVMLSIRWVGVLLINALLILPAAAARNIARSVAQHALLSVLISVFSGVAGLCVSVPLGCGVGAAVVLCAAVCYAVSLLLGRALRVRLQA